MVYFKCCGIWMGCRSKTSAVNRELDLLLLYFLSVHFSCRGILCASGVYRVDFSWYYFISSSSLALDRDATRIPMGFSPHQLPYCLSYFLHLNTESAISCMVVCVSVKTYLVSFFQVVCRGVLWT